MQLFKDLSKYVIRDVGSKLPDKWDHIFFQFGSPIVNLFVIQLSLVQ
jgi:hypothetical protein